jgi:hypothetical protein
MFTRTETGTVHSAPFKQNQTQFLAYRRLATCSAWNPASAELITSGRIGSRASSRRTAGC